MRLATELALVEDVANDHHFAANPDAARSYAAEMIADYVEIAARIWATDRRNPAPRPIAPVSRPHDDAEPTAAPSENDPGSGHILIDELRTARRSAGWSQATLGKRVGVDAQTIKRIEQGRGSVKTLVKLMAALNFRLSGLGKGKTLAAQLRNKRGKQLPAKLTKKAGISPATVVALERGEGTVASLLRLLAVLAPRVRRRAPERAYWGQGDEDDRDSRFTSPAFMANIYAAFGEVSIDPCGHQSSPVIAHRRILFAEGGDGLTEDWSGRLAYVNPPYSAAARWLNRAHEQWVAGNVQTVVCLVPVRTDSGLFHEV
jgi:transcriptional regulator with XRE-family HTH domain